MSLHKHVSAEKVLRHSAEQPHRHGNLRVSSLMERENKSTTPEYDIAPIPKHQLPSKSLPAQTAYELIHNELTLDGNPLLNLASFVHTWMPPEADKLMAENVGKNLIDASEYPQTQVIAERCVSMIATLWHADEKKNATGCATTGSSEAIQLAGLAMKRKWQEKMRAAGKDEYRPGPNVIMGANAQVALEKFARYFDVECRLVPVSEESSYVMDPKRAMQYVDENTIGIFVILGSTYTGAYEGVEEMSNLLDAYEKESGNNVPIHVDGASGGFVAPFATPSLKWDFRIPRVVSINASGHKFGGAYVGVGWVVWRDKAHLPKDMVFELSYLGSNELSFSLNFSRPAAPIIAQYFNFIHLGFEGYRKLSINDAKNARLLSRALENSKYYKVVSNIHLPVTAKGSIMDKVTKVTGLSDNIEDYTPGLPVVAFKFSDAFKKEYPTVKQKWIQTLLRSREWIVPNYELPPDVKDQEILRVVLRQKFTEDLVERLVTDIIEVTESLMSDAGSAHVQHMDAIKEASHEKKKVASHDEGGVKPTGHGSVC